MSEIERHTGQGEVITPAQIERRLVMLAGEINQSQVECDTAERTYFHAKGQYEIGIAKARMEVAREFVTRGEKATVQEKEDAALLRVPELLIALYDAEAIVKAARGNVARLRTQVDITRSVAVSVRAALEL